MSQHDTLTPEQLDQHLDAILKAAGSALRHYTMQKSRDDMRAALSAALSATTHAEAAGLTDAAQQALDAMQDLTDGQLEYEANQSSKFADSIGDAARFGVRRGYNLARQAIAALASKGSGEMVKTHRLVFKEIDELVLAWAKGKSADAETEEIRERRIRARQRLEEAIDHLAASPDATVQGAGQAVEQLRRDFARECVDTDTLLRLLDLKPDEVRTDGGSLNLPRLASLIEARKQQPAVAQGAGEVEILRDSVAAKADRIDRLGEIVERQQNAMRAVMGRLAEMLDEDQFAHIENLVIRAGYTPPTQPAPVVPEGWRLVPMQATLEMCAAAHYGPQCAEDDMTDKDMEWLQEMWSAMLAATPTPPAQAAQQGEKA